MASLRAAALPPGARIDSFEIVRVVGTGGFGITYEAYDNNLKRHVALKEYFPADIALRAEDGMTLSPRTPELLEDYRYGLERFLDEARVLARFQNPYVVRVVRFLEAHGTAYLVMELEEGASLQSRLRRQGALPEETVRRYVIALLTGLSEVHSKGYLHRDVKPANVIIRADDSPVLLDFGAAREAMGAMTDNVTVMYTPGYAPMEQYATSGEFGPWTDIYAVGATALHLLHGSQPPPATDRVLAISTAKPDPVEAVFETLRDTVSNTFLNTLRWMVAPGAADRPQSVESVLARLSDESDDTLLPKHSSSAGIAPELSSPGSAGSTRTAFASPTWRRRASLFVTCVGVLAVGVGAWGVLTQEKGTTAPVRQEVNAGTPQDAPPAPREAEGVIATPRTERDDSQLAKAGPEAIEPPEVSDSPTSRSTLTAARVDAAKDVSAIAKPSQAPTVTPKLEFADGLTSGGNGPPMVRLRRGQFMLGSPDNEPGRDADEAPRQQVQVNADFAMSVYEITRAQFSQFVDNTGYVTSAERDAERGCMIDDEGWQWTASRTWRTPGFTQTALEPVVCVSWLDAMAYVRWLSAETGQNYGLPTEALWEYAARAGTSSARPWDDVARSCEFANVSDLTRVTMHGLEANADNIFMCEDQFAYTSPAGRFAPNAFALYDMLGNVWEWTSDCWGERYPDNVTLAPGTKSCELVAFRGGSWVNTPNFVRSASRAADSPENRYFNVGFRVVRTQGPSIELSANRNREVYP